MSDLETGVIGPAWGAPVSAEPVPLVDEVPAPASRPRRRRIRRIRYRVGMFRRTASLLELVILWAILAAIVSAVFAGIVAGISLALHRVGG
ncbi:MAG: hypothetical protein ACYDEN_09500 [Acidimicrobiales bacterium]